MGITRRRGTLLQQRVNQGDLAIVIELIGTNGEPPLLDGGEKRTMI